jgi:hypothetical protein
MDHSTDVSTTLPSAIDLELTINQIKGIYASCVIFDGARHVNEIHIVASNARKPKPIIRDIETMLLVKHSTKIDYRTISMVQIPDAQLLRIPIARPEIREVKEEPMGDRMRVRVMIRGAGRVAKGEAFEKIDNPSPFRTSAQATINAIEKLLNSTIDVRLEDAQTFRLGVREVLVVIVTSLIDGREETFVGSSFVGASLVESAARATLDALNRRIHTLSLQAPRESDTPESF